MASADAVELGRSGGCNLERGDGPGDFSVGAVEAVRLLEGAARPGQCGIGSALADGYFGRFAGSAVHGDGVVLLNLCGRQCLGIDGHFFDGSGETSVPTVAGGTDGPVGSGGGDGFARSSGRGDLGSIAVQAPVGAVVHAAQLYPLAGRQVGSRNWGEGPLHRQVGSALYSLDPKE